MENSASDFASKDALAAEAASHAFAETTARMRERALASDHPAATAIRLYLSAEHRDSVATGCAIAALSQEAARGSPALRAAFDAGIAGYLDLIVELAGVSRAEAMAIYATMVGALTLSRTVTDPALADDILVAATNLLLSANKPPAVPLSS